MFVEIYEGLCELGCALNAFSIEYDTDSELQQKLAMIGESHDSDAANLHEYLNHLESYCDLLHEQRLFCDEAQRLIMFIAAAAVRCDTAVKLCTAKRQQLQQDPHDDDKMKRQQLDDIDDEKRVVENDYQRVFNYGVEELTKLRASLQTRLQEIIKGGTVDPLAKYHSKSLKQYDDNNNMKSGEN